MKKIPISDATDEQLRTFALDIQQLSNVPQARSAILAALIEGGWSSDYILVDGDPAPAASTDSSSLAGEEPAEELAQFENVREVAAPMPAQGFAFWTKPEEGKPSCPMVTLRILTTERPGGKDPAHPIINNSPPLVIQRGKLVRIPWDFYKVLKGAGGTAGMSNVANPNEEIQTVDYIEYPMTDVVLPTKAEVDAWDKWAGSHELGNAKAA